MSLTIMIEIRTRRVVETMLRRRGRAASFRVDRLSVMVLPLGRVRHGVRQFPGASWLRLEQQRTGRRDHAPSAVERALAQLKAEQAVALERTRSASSPVFWPEKPKRA